jgi:hypothetical protein
MDVVLLTLLLDRALASVVLACKERFPPSLGHGFGPCLDNVLQVQSGPDPGYYIQCQAAAWSEDQCEDRAGL